MHCRVCNSLCVIHEHNFYTGLAHHVRMGHKLDNAWNYPAPLYHKIDYTHSQESIIPFCSPTCATEYNKNVDQ